MQAGIKDSHTQQGDSMTGSVGRLLVAADKKAQHGHISDLPVSHQTVCDRKEEVGGAPNRLHVRLLSTNVQILAASQHRLDVYCR